MKVSYRWLKEIAPGYMGSASELTEALALRGAPVENVLTLGAEIEEVVVARVVEAGRHPNADRLSLCRVDAGGPELLSVVCGAPNVRAGAYYPFAPAGSTLPGGLKLRKAKIRGEVSEGMLCSEKELGLGGDQGGIMELSEFPVGTPFVEALGLNDTQLDVEITANRPDLLSHRGVARELVGEDGLRVPRVSDQSPALAFQSGEASVEAGGVRISIEDTTHCWRYLGAVIRGVRVGPSPAWLQSRLRAVGARPINNVVDATNYVMLELGQPLHAFDLGKLAGAEILVRGARPGESLVTLDGVARSLADGMLAICDSAGPVAVAGVMGGEASEVSDSSMDILIECALFEPAQVRRTRRALDLPSEASYRYERGVDPEGQEAALARAVELVLATAGGVADPMALDVQPRPWSRRRIVLRPERVRHVLGIEMPDSAIEGLLSPLGFVADREPSGTLAFQVPGFRSYDVTREIDLIEEVARTHGYDRFPDELRPFRPSSVPDHPLFQLEARLRTRLTGLGVFEAHTLPFSARGEVEIPRPLSADATHLRDSLLPGLLRVLEYNFHRSQRDLRFFEIGTVFGAGATGEKPLEQTRLAIAVTGRRRPAHWSGAEGQMDFWDIKGLLDSVLELVGGSTETGPDPSPLAGPHLEGQWSARSEGRPLGVAGRISPSALDAPPWVGTVWGLELILPADGAPRQSVAVRPLPAFPAAERDLALLVPVGTTARMVAETLKAHGGPLLVRAELFDLYEGEGVPAGRKSLAFRLRYQAADRTLRDEDVEDSVRRVLAALKETLDVDART